MVFYSLQSYMTSLVTPYYNYVGFHETSSDAHLAIYSRNDAMAWACKLLVPDCVHNSKAKYAAFMKDPNNRYVINFIHLHLRKSEHCLLMN